MEDPNIGTEAGVFGNEAPAPVDEEMVTKAQDFADQVATKVEDLKSGTLTVESFVEGCKETLDTMFQSGELPLGGLGQDQGFSLPGEDE